MLVGCAGLMMVAMSAFAESPSSVLFDQLEGVEELNADRVSSQDEIVRDLARGSTSIAAGQIVQTPDGCLYYVRFRDGDAVLAPVLDDKLDKQCLTGTL